MKLSVAIFVICVAAAAAYDDVWMKLTAARIMDAEMDMESAGNRTILELADDLGLTALVHLMKKTNLSDTLSSAGPYTVFGPTNRAFMKLPRPIAKYLIHNATALKEVLKYHVLEGSFLSTDLKNNQLIPSLQGGKIRVNIYKNGSVITASGRQVREADQKATNGVIQEVSGVLLPPPGTVVDLVDKCPAFNTLKKALNISALTDLLKGDGPFTVFAPTDRAFDRIPKRCLDKLMANKTLLADVLKYHVVTSAEYSAGLSCGDKLVTANNMTVFITKFLGRLRVNHSRVEIPDVSLTNGVVHVIDRVLWPRREGDEFCGDKDALYDDYNNNNKDDSVYKAFLGLRK